MWGLIDQKGISLVSNPWHHASKAVLSGRISFLLLQVIQSVAVDVIVLVRSEKEGRGDPCLKLPRELFVRSWDESERQRGERRETHAHLDRTKAYNCMRIRPRGIPPFHASKQESFEL